MRLLKWIICVALLLGTVRSGVSFSLLGPIAAWQGATYDGYGIGYNLAGDIGAPRVPNEGYRWNVPVINYALDSTFINYFGTNGIAAIEAAVAIINDIPEVTLITNDGGSFYIRGEPVPYDSRRVNHQAETLGLLDIKSTALTVLLEELGLAEPERFAWTLAGRAVFGPPPNITNYTTFNMNFDPITLLPSPYVNGVLYSYQILEQRNPNISDAVEFAVDPVSATRPFSSVAGGFGNGGLGVFVSGLQSGFFYTGLTHDDIGGLRWLYSTNNVAVESLLPNTVGGRPATTGGNGGSPWGGFFSFTNFFFTGTNFTFNTNIFGTNITNFIVTGLRPGINKVRYQRVNFDSLLGQTFIPITNRFTDTSISNSRPIIQPVQRAVLQPDIIFTAERLPLVDNLVPALLVRTGTGGWQNNDALNGQDTEIDGGPGVISPTIFIRFSDQLPFFLNDTFFSFLDEATAVRGAIWGSFDGTTNAPIVYPQYAPLTIQQIRRQLGL